jgi:4,5-dihydroxyphthalate decarboxylase
MAKLKLTVATNRYDFLQPLREGSVQAEGLDLNLIHEECGVRHHQMLHHRLYDASEFSMGSYLVARSRGQDSLQAIPFFMRRMFCHRFCFVRSDSDIQKPADLRGRRIGLITYQNSLAIFFKGFLAHQYHVAATDVTWVTMLPERVENQLLSGIKIERAESRKSMEELLLEGKIDAFLEPDLPKSWQGGRGAVRRLFPDYEKEEKEFYQQSQVFPIMHPLVIQKEILDQDPWVATSLYEAFNKSQKLYDESIRHPHRVSFVWPRREEEREFFGKNPFYQGFSENRHDVEYMIQLATEQGLLACALGADELFAPQALRT